MESKLYVKTPNIEQMEMFRDVMNGIAFVEILQNQGSVTENLFDFYPVVGDDGYWVCLTDCWDAIPELAQPVAGAIYEILPQINQPNSLLLDVVETSEPENYGFYVEGVDPVE